MTLCALRPQKARVSWHKNSEFEKKASRYGWTRCLNREERHTVALLLVIIELSVKKRGARNSDSECSKIGR
ncbi:hypothetical protein L596_015453 [Steinernema carpocapsae]|uniref:Uncharacterized protein n=1 Tax=Steinernema carpocapsae TaxID=34508 RepID=A0A4U5NF14_STECR|nr:hypothetical protein L596_015453 [Steinernema carpocapsae]